MIGQRFWFEPATAWSLAMCRVLFYAAVLALYGGEDFRFVASLSEIVWEPVGFARWLPFGAPSAGVIGLLQIAWRVSLVAALAGLATRLSTLAAFGLGLYLLVLPYCVSRVAHESAAMAIGLGVMAVARPGDALSIDRWLRRRSPAPPPSGEYRWPVQLMRVVVSLVFFSGGVTKLRLSGLAWIYSDHMERTLLEHWTPLSAWVAAHPFLCRLLASATVVIETLHPLSLFAAAAACIFVPAGIGLLLGIRLVMGIPFWPLVAVHVFWIPWDRLRRPAA